jgi:hypothetical protein
MISVRALLPAAVTPKNRSIIARFVQPVLIVEASLRP